jgi:hypothetical protein
MSSCSLVHSYHSFEGACCFCRLIFYLAVVAAFSCKVSAHSPKKSPFYWRQSYYSQSWETQVLLITLKLVLKICDCSQNIVEAQISPDIVLQLDRSLSATNIWRKKTFQCTQVYDPPVLRYIPLIILSRNIFRQGAETSNIKALVFLERVTMSKSKLCYDRRSVG